MWNTLLSHHYKETKLNYCAFCVFLTISQEKKLLKSNFHVHYYRSEGDAFVKGGHLCFKKNML